MPNGNPHHQLFNTQCNGLSAAWARAAADEARDLRHADLHPHPSSAQGGRVRWGGLALAATAVTVLWLLVSPAESGAKPLAGAAGLALKMTAA